MEKNSILETGLKARTPPDHQISELLLGRWSPRAMSGASLTDQELMPLFEAARWAPSSYNAQPWRFLYAHRESKEWPLFFDLMIEFNQSWTKNAAVLLVMTSAKNFEHNGKPAHTHQFDAGAAWMSLALEGTRRGLVVHGMEGFDYEKARKNLEIPEGYSVLAMAAIGKPGPVSVLAPETQKREQPSPRKPLTEIIRKGKFKA